MNEDLLKDADIQDIAARGTAIYETIKDHYDPTHIGKFLAIEVDSRDVFLAAESSEALQKAREAYPDKVFYIVRIGFDSAEAMARVFMRSAHA